MKGALFYAYDPTQAGPTQEELAAWLAFDQAVKDAGAFVYEAGLHPASTAHTVRVRDGQVATAPEALASDGTVLAGFYVLDVATMNDAVQWAQQLPTATYGRVEVRPIVEY